MGVLFLVSAVTLEYCRAVARRNSTLHFSVLYSRAVFTTWSPNAMTSIPLLRPLGSVSSKPAPRYFDASLKHHVQSARPHMQNIFGNMNREKKLRDRNDAASLARAREPLSGWYGTLRDHLRRVDMHPDLVAQGTRHDADEWLSQSVCSHIWRS